MPNFLFSKRTHCESTPGLAIAVTVFSPNCEVKWFFKMPSSPSTVAGASSSARAFSAPLAGRTRSGGDYVFSGTNECACYKRPPAKPQPILGMCAEASCL